ncbi:hypothetical protein A5650_23295 [Mycobacterium sp. 1164985.4]|nr:hypothetical protein A5650_23295 [Mycobacterium sp. 1164985.4]
MHPLDRGCTIGSRIEATMTFNSVRIEAGRDEAQFCSQLGTTLAFMVNAIAIRPIVDSVVGQARRSLLQRVE